MKKTYTILALVGAAIFFPAAAVAQDDGASEKSSAELRDEYYQFEEAFFELYNKLNDDSRYDVYCSSEAPIGSRIKQQVCRPAFIARAISRGQINNTTDVKKNAAIAEQTETYMAKMNELIAANPELQVAAARYSEARALYMADSEAQGND